jgi:hypothetical protein
LQHQENSGAQQPVGAGFLGLKRGGIFLGLQTIKSEKEEEDKPDSDDSIA